MMILRLDPKHNLYFFFVLQALSVTQNFHAFSLSLARCDRRPFGFENRATHWNPRENQMRGPLGCYAQLDFIERLTNGKVNLELNATEIKFTNWKRVITKWPPNWRFFDTKNRPRNYQIRRLKDNFSTYATQTEYNPTRLNRYAPLIMPKLNVGWFGFARTCRSQYFQYCQTHRIRHNSPFGGFTYANIASLNTTLTLVQFPINFTNLKQN